MRLTRIFALVGCLLASPLFAVTRTWTGAIDGSWSVGGNWVGGVAPASGDDLLFPVGASNLTNVNNFPAGTTFNSITQQDVNYFSGGNAIILNAGISAPNGGHVLIPITLAVSQAFDSANNGLFIGAVNLNDKTLTLAAAGGLGLATGTISGAGTIIKSGDGGYVFGATNTFSGQLQINGGVINASDANALGVGDNTLANGTVVANGASLVVNAAIANEYIQVNGTGSFGNGVLISVGSGVLGGTVELGPNVGMIVQSPNTLQFNGVVTGGGRFGMGGNGTYILANSGNDFTGSVLWGATGTSTSTLRLANSNVVPDNASLDIPSSGTFDVNSQTETITSLSGAGAVTLGGSASLTILNATGTYSGAVSGNGAIILAGGNLTWQGPNSYTGTFIHSAGTFVLTLPTATLPAALTQIGGTFGISSGATAGSVTINAGTFGPGIGGSALANTGNLALAAGSTYSESINGTTSTAFGNVHVTGTISLGNSTLLLSGSGAGVLPGMAFTIIENDGSDPVAGTFLGLPEGGVIIGGPGGFDYRISYAGGTGNDIVVTALAPGAIPALDPRALVLLALMLGVIAIVSMSR